MALLRLDYITMKSAKKLAPRLIRRLPNRFQLNGNIDKNVDENIFIQWVKIPRTSSRSLLFVRPSCVPVSGFLIIFSSNCRHLFTSTAYQRLNSLFLYVSSIHLR